MTCIVGLVEDGKVYIGGDSAGIAGYSTTVRADSKVFKNGPFIMGFTSSFRMGQILRYKFKAPKQAKSKTDLEYMATDFIDAVIKCFEKNKFSTTVEGGIRITGGTFLVGYKGNIYTIEDDFQVGLPTEKFASVGCGQDLALGSLFSTKNLIINDPKRRIVLALEAATLYSAGVLPPYTILNL